MALLCIVALMRVFYLRMFIVLSPLLILLFCLDMGQDKIKIVEKASKTMKEKGISVPGFMGLAFKPVIITLGISLALIFTVLMKRTIIMDQEIDFYGTKIGNQNTTSSQTLGDEQYETTFDNPLLKVTVNGLKKTFKDLILTVITLVFTRIIVKMAFTSGSGIKAINEFTKNTFNSIEKFGKNIPFIPIG